MTLPSDMNLAWSDPVLQHAVDALATGDLLPGYKALADSVGDSDRRELYVDVLGDVGAVHLRDLRAEAERADDDPHWWLLSGSAARAAAWAARGEAQMKYTSEQQVRGLLGLSRESRDMLRLAVKLAPEDPVPWTVLQSIAKAAPIPQDEPHVVWNRLLALAPDSFLGNHQRLSILCRKWYGSTEQMLGFARERCTTLPDGHPLWSLAPQSYIEVWVDGWMVGNLAARVYRVMTSGPLKKRTARAEVDAASDRFLAGAAAYADHPWLMVAHQIFGAYYHKAGVRDRARTHLERGGERASSWPWGYFPGEQQAALTGARSSAGLG
ncbi:hypothetical protein I0C86_25805 [Plantactinospora sp. S1510]|uniref:DUF4034 domain-containing protein n=1 Tax=Plantactinospora alkalitolerans TaxID=2789879 RepID=A0ABS0H1K1_9ACTN|nr:hypothetical protein [Plantactinospora alkalitolerans]MBF9132336.1 hypothetical protein [Plantactinospora alkalitolerans]